VKLVDARWALPVNELVVRCECGRKFAHPVNRWRVRCPSCGRSEHIDAIRVQPITEG
jgi:Zn finger protein HypA/HybF involved in hydrogenase expression